MSRNQNSAPAPSARDTIRNAAERLFATHGYDGTSMRLIAEAAGVAQALLHYHFQNKDTLYAAIFESRSAIINARREALLDELFTGGRQPSLEDVLEVMFVPAAEILESTADEYEYFGQLVATLGMANDPRSIALMTRFYDPIAGRFIAAIRKTVPGLSKARAVRCYLFALGARTQAYANSHRAERLAGNTAPDDDISVTAILVPFVAAGIRFVAAAPAAFKRGKAKALQAGSAANSKR